MPLFERARVEVYLPDLPDPAYHRLLDELDREFTYTFGGCTIVRGLEGSYLSSLGQPMRDRVNLVYTDAPFGFEDNFKSLSRFTEQLREAVFTALREEAILVVAFEVCHSG